MIPKKATYVVFQSIFTSVLYTTGHSYVHVLFGTFRVTNSIMTVLFCGNSAAHYQARLFISQPALVCRAESNLNSDHYIYVPYAVMNLRHGLWDASKCICMHACMRACVCVHVCVCVCACACVFTDTDCYTYTLTHRHNKHDKKPNRQLASLKSCKASKPFS
jgi:hypothetical protein